MILIVLLWYMTQETKIKYINTHSVKLGAIVSFLHRSPKPNEWSIVVKIVPVDKHYLNITVLNSQQQITTTTMIIKTRLVQCLC